MKNSRVSRFQWIMLLAGMCYSISGCVHLATSLGFMPKKPDISLADFQVKSASLSQIDVEVVLNVLNQDSKELEIDDLNFDLLLSETTLGSGRAAEKIAVKPNTKQSVQIPISLQTKELLGVAVDLMSGKAKDKARIRGSASIKTWAGFIAVPFDREIGK
jgi:LEA14-like dessication related protein